MTDKIDHPSLGEVRNSMIWYPLVSVENKNCLQSVPEVE